MACVLDASAAMSILAPNQATTASRAFEQSPPPDLVAPAHFAIELRHAILKLERRGILQPGATDRRLLKLEGSLSFDAAPDAGDLAAWVTIARTEQLGLYDASYLELALRLGAALAGRDKGLLQAARRRGVQVLDLR